MAIISKEYFYKSLGPKLTCSEVLHPLTESCSKALLKFLVQVGIGSSQVFLLVHTLQTINERKNVDKKYIKNQIYGFVRNMVFALCFGLNFHGSLCLLRRNYGNFFYYAVALSGFSAGLAVFLRDPIQRPVDTAISVNFAVETILRYLCTENVIKNTVVKESLLFMTCSGILMFLLKNRSEKAAANFWFYYPSRRKLSTNPDTCIHKHSCFNHSFKGFSRYFVIGYVVQIVKQLLPVFHKFISNPAHILEASLNMDLFLSGLVFGGYVGIYRIVRCFLLKKYKSEKPWHPLLGGFLAGSTYIFKPTMPLLAIAVTTILQLLVQQSTCLSSLQSKLPARELIFAVCTGIIFHARMLIPDSCPPYIKQLMSTTSNGKVNDIYKHSSHILKNLKIAQS